MPKRIKPVHPGEILYEEFMKPMNITQYRLAKDINVQPTIINKIIKGERSISVDTATRLGIYFKMGG
jgi:addiction module HigA family antidote